MANDIKNVDFSSQRIREASAGMWQDFIFDLVPFRRYSGYANDFRSWVPDEWTSTEVGTCTQTLLDERNGVLRLTAGGTENNGNNLQLGGTGDSETIGESFAPAAGKNLYFECRIKSVTDADQTDVFVGLHVEDTTVVAGRGSDYIGFRIDDGDANVDVECAASSAASEETGVGTMTESAYLKLGFKVSSTSKVEYYVDDVLQATISTNIPTALMKLTIASLTGENTGNALDVDYVICYQER